MSSNQFQFVDGLKNKQVLKDGYLFTYELSNSRKSTANDKFYKCSTRTCPSRIVLNKEDKIKKEYLNHNHDPHNRKMVKRDFILKAKQFTKVGDTASTVYNKVLDLMDIKDQSKLKFVPTFNLVKSTINKNKSSKFPREPFDLVDLKINGDYIVDRHGEHFLQYIDTETDKMVVYFLDSKIKILAEADIVVVDGTFKSAPKLFKQVFTIHFVIQNHCVPVLFALLSDKTTRSYTKVLNVLKSRCDYLGIEFKPKVVFSDFELAIVNSFRNVYNIRIRGCWFHFVQAIYKKINFYGLSIAYKRDPQFYKLCRMLFNLALIPPSLVKSYFNIISNEMKGIKKFKVNPFLNYFHKTWISETARYPISIWNHYKDEFRSSSCIEG